MHQPADTNADTARPVNPTAFYAELSMMAAMLPNCTIEDTPDDIDFEPIFFIAKIKDKGKRESALVSLDSTRRSAAARIVMNACDRILTKLSDA